MGRTIHWNDFAWGGLQRTKKTTHWTSIPECPTKWKFGSGKNLFHLLLWSLLIILFDRTILSSHFCFRYHSQLICFKVVIFFKQMIMQRKIEKKVQDKFSIKMISKIYLRIECGGNFARSFTDVAIVTTKLFKTFNIITLRWSYQSLFLYESIVLSHIAVLDLTPFYNYELFEPLCKTGNLRRIENKTKSSQR